MIHTAKEKIQSLISSFSERETSEKMAVIITLLVFILIFVIVFVLINLFLPKTNIEISISGPTTAKAGEEISYSVTVKNTGTVVLKDPELVFHYPSFSLPEKSLIETRKTGDVYPNQEVEFTFKGMLFGMEEEKRESKAWLNYSTDGRTKITMSNVVSLTTAISEVPLDLVVDLPRKAPIYPRDQSDFSVRIRYLSFMEQPVSNMKLLVGLPSDFQFKESFPQINQEQKFEIPTLEPRGRGEVEIMGSFPARYQIGKELKFNAQLFINLHGTDVLLKEESITTVTYEPAFFFSQTINNEEIYHPDPGEKLYYQIYFKNIQNEPLRDLSLTTILDGSLFDLATIEAPKATLTRGTNFISWTGTNTPSLRYLTPGEEGKVEFWVTLKDDYKPKDTTDTNAIIRNRIVLAEFETEFRSRVNSLIKISQEGYSRDRYGFFENTGPQPPRVNETTQYTIVWKLENYYNWTENIKIKAALPQGVHVRAVKPTHGKITVSTAPDMPKPYPDIPTDFRFQRALYEGISNIDITYLQIILKEEVPRLYSKHVPATGYFGPLTREAVKGFQQKYRREILDPQNIQSPTGYVDELTRLKLNELLAKGAPVDGAEMVWELDKVNPGVGVLEEAWIAAFQISFTPELSQKGKIVNIMDEVEFSAQDQWTKTLLLTSDKAIDTTLPHDTRVRTGTIR